MCVTKDKSFPWYISVDIKALWNKVRDGQKWVGPVQVLITFGDGEHESGTELKAVTPKTNRPNGWPQASGWEELCQKMFVSTYCPFN